MTYTKKLYSPGNKPAEVGKKENSIQDCLRPPIGSKKII